MKLDPIERKYVLEASDALDKEGYKDNFDYVMYVAEKMKNYPFKALMIKAFYLATGEKIDGRYFHSGNGTRQRMVEKLGYPISFRMDKEVPFFTWGDLDVFSRVAGKEYRSNMSEGKAIGTTLRNTVILKTATWANAIQMSGFSVELDNSWQSRGVYATYTWARIYKTQDAGKKVFFTVGVDPGEQALIYKLDCQHSASNAEHALSAAQTAIFDRMVDPPRSLWQLVIADKLKDYDWGKLVGETRAYIEHYLPLYDEIIRAIWESPAPRSGKDALFEQAAPVGGQFPSKRGGKVTTLEVDYESQYKRKKEVGDAGEALVIQREVHLLQEAGLSDLAEKVEKVPDWSGFDIQSYYPDGKDKLIEVKTTVGTIDRPFYLTANEVAIMQENPESYCLYRLYNYDRHQNTAEYFLLYGDVYSQLTIEATGFAAICT